MIVYKQRALAYFDDVTHIGYQVAPKAWETIYCRREPSPFESAYPHLDFSKDIFEFDVAKEETGPFKVTAKWDEEQTDEQKEIKKKRASANEEMTQKAMNETIQTFGGTGLHLFYK
jgi:hypothetical protein